MIGYADYFHYTCCTLRLTISKHFKLKPESSPNKTVCERGSAVGVRSFNENKMWYAQLVGA